MVSKEGKHFLNNTLKSLTHQNKVKEEIEMWKQLERTKRRSELRHQYLIEKQNRHRNKSKHRKNVGPNVWMRKLMQLEESDPNRWGHSGFKELYPEEFDESSDNEDQQSSHSEQSSKSSEKSDKNKKHSSKRKHKKQKKHKNKRKNKHKTKK